MSRPASLITADFFCSVKVHKKDDDHVKYCVETKMSESGTQKTWRRYNEFRELNKKLRKLGIQDQDLTPLPGKKYLTNRFSEQLINDRIRDLNSWVSTRSLRAPRWADHPRDAFEKFTGVDLLRGQLTADIGDRLRKTCDLEDGLRRQLVDTEVRERDFVGELMKERRVIMGRESLARDELFSFYSKQRVSAQLLTALLAEEEGDRQNLENLNVRPRAQEISARAVLLRGEMFSEEANQWHCVEKKMGHKIPSRLCRPGGGGRGRWCGSEQGGGGVAGFSMFQNWGRRAVGGVLCFPGQGSGSRCAEHCGGHQCGFRRIGGVPGEGVNGSGTYHE